MLKNWYLITITHLVVSRIMIKNNRCWSDKREGEMLIHSIKYKLNLKLWLHLHSNYVWHIVMVTYFRIKYTFLPIVCYFSNYYIPCSRMTEWAHPGALWLFLGAFGVHYDFCHERNGCVFNTKYPPGWTLIFFQWLLKTVLLIWVSTLTIINYKTWIYGQGTLTDKVSQHLPSALICMIKT